MDAFQIRLLGDFSLAYQGKQIQNADNRSRKVWTLLAYMIYRRNENVTTEELTDLLWSGEEGSSNPNNALKTVFHRVRSTLDQLGEGVGHKLIIRRAGGYCLSPALTLELDIVRFEALCRQADKATDPEERLLLSLDALDMYQGDFLPKLSSESWVIPISAYYHNLYMQTVYEALELLASSAHADRAVWLCRRAIEIEPYDETLYTHLMRHLLSLGEQQSAVLVYERFSQILFTQFGVMPSDELRALHREAMRETGEHQVDLQSVAQDILESSSMHGALYCDYDFFKAIYSAEARILARSGAVMHIALLSISAADGSPLAKRSLTRCMDNLRPLICEMLRRGDIVSRCSVSQFILLLPNANYENSCMVMDRIVRKFGRQYPHSPAFLRVSVQPIKPN